MKDADIKTRDKKVTRYIHKIFWTGMFQNKKYLTIGYTNMVAIFFAHVYIPLLVAYAIQAIINRRFDLVSNYVTQIILLLIIYNLISAFSTWGLNRTGIGAAAYVQKKIFNNYLNKDYEFYSDNYIGALGAQAARLRDALIDYHLMMHVDGPKIIVIILASTVVLAYHSPLLALITLGCMAFVLSYTVFSSKYRLKYRRMVSQASSELAGVMGDSLSHGSTIKSFATEDYENKRLLNSLAVWEKAQLKSWDLFTPANVGRNILSTLTICVLLIVTSRMYQQNDISIAVVALVQLYMIKLIGITLDIATIIKLYEAVMGAAYQPVATMLVRSKIKDPVEPRKLPKIGTAEVAFNDISFLYPDAAAGQEAIQDFRLTVKNGEKIGLVGFSGSGKTTLTKLLLRFMDVNEGSIQLDGIDVRELAQHDLRRFIAYVPQEPLLFHRSIAENIGYGKPRASQKEVLNAAQLAYVDEFVRELPRGYDTLVGERGVKLSGGQRQRVAIARALLKDAPVLVLDEATSALDSQSEQYIQKALAQLMKHRTTIVIAHRLSTIQRMDKIVVMDKGKIVQTGTHDELLKDANGIYARLWNHQSGGYIGSK